MTKKRKKQQITLPGLNCSVELEPASIQDPFEPAKQLTVMKNIRVHPLDSMVARKTINAPQKEAGDRFLELFDRAEIGGARAIDYSQVKVDISFTHRGLPKGVAEAVQELKEIRQHLGARYYALLVSVIGDRMAVYDLARARDKAEKPTYATLSYFTAALRLALDDLTEFWGVGIGATRPRRHQFEMSVENELEHN
ncbi:MAG: hypothetical protein WDN46_14215 [Methylocella sp.]